MREFVNVLPMFSDDRVKRALTNSVVCPGCYGEPGDPRTYKFTWTDTFIVIVYMLPSIVEYLLPLIGLMLFVVFVYPRVSPVVVQNEFNQRGIAVYGAADR